MTTVKCTSHECEFFKDGECRLDELEIEGRECASYISHMDYSREYRCEYFRHMKDNEGNEYKVRAMGKRYEMIGLVWYTSDDDRYGTDEIFFTEEVSGVREKGKHIKEENAGKIKKVIRDVTPVADLLDSTEMPY